MKVVIADTSPINYLVLIGCIDVLQKLYKHVVIPAEVFEELTNDGAPSEVTSWMQDQPTWLEIRFCSTNRYQPSELADLGAGEQAAIQLALLEHEVLLLLDESAGRAVASHLGIATTGTLGILVAAAKVGLIDLKTSLGKLQSTNFRVSQWLIDKVVASLSQNE